jgi:hypothetical protein
MQGNKAFGTTSNIVKCVSGTEITYDYWNLVCPGIQLDWNEIVGQNGGKESE